MKLVVCRRVRIGGTLFLLAVVWTAALMVYADRLDSAFQELVAFRVDGGTSDRERRFYDDGPDEPPPHANWRNEIRDEKTLIFPEENLRDWTASSELFRTHDDLTTVRNGREQARRDFGLANYAFDVLVSDKVGPRRRPPDHRHPLCRNLTYPAAAGALPRASVVIVYHHEALSVLIRMVNGILLLTPGDLLHEIVLLDDWSDEKLIIQPYLEQYAAENWPSFVKFHRTLRREGLIRARMHGANLATGQVLVFLDSHCEVTEKWLEPLLTRIQQNWTNVVVPIVDIIDPRSFNHSEGMVSRGAFDWGLHFKWIYLPWSYFDDPQNNTDPLPSAAMSGGLFAIDRKYFNYLGQYDAGMDIWGAENIELSIRIWLCGGSLEVMPCSRVGHVFRHTRPYGNPNNTDTDSRNTMRTVEVWLDDEHKDRYYRRKAWLRGQPFGDISDRLALRRRLNCRNFQWFLDNVYPDLKNQ